MDRANRPLRAALGGLTAILTAIVLLTPPAGAQVKPTGVHRLGPQPERLGMESTPPPDLRWDEHSPRSRPAPPAADDDGGIPRRRTADPARLEGIFRYRFAGEHGSSATGYSISFSQDADCDGFSEVLIGAPHFGGALGDPSPGAAYLVSMADVAAADAADGAVDRVIDLGLTAAQPRSWKLVGEGRQSVGMAVSSGDADGDGCSDLLIGAPGDDSDGSAYVISASDLPAADAADGAADGVVDIRRTPDQPDSWELTSGSRLAAAGYRVDFAGDVNGDGRSDLSIGAPSFRDERAPGFAYLLSGAALASADAADGVADGRIAVASVAAQPDSWQFVGENPGDAAGFALSSANLDADPRSDLVIGAIHHTAGLEHQGAAYLVAAADLPAMDRADGAFDGVIDLGNAAAGRASWKLVGDTDNRYIGFGTSGDGVSAGDLDGDGLDEVVVASAGGDGDAAAFVVSIPDLPSADEADGAVDGVARLEHALAQDDSFKLVWGETHQFSVSADADIDGDGLKDVLVGSLDFQQGSSCLPDGGARRNGAVAIMPGGSLPSADAGDGAADSIVDLNRVSSRDGLWKFIGGPTDRLGTAVTAGDIDGDGKADPILASLLPHTPYGECGAGDGTGFVFLMSNAHLGASDALDGATDGEIYLDALRVEADPEAPEVIGISQFENSVVVMRVTGSLKTAEFDFPALAGSFHQHYPDEFDYIVFVSNLPTRDHNQHYTYYGMHHSVRNAVRGTGVEVFGSEGTLKATIHMPYRTAILRGPMLHEFLHDWANFVVPTSRGSHWGFSSAHGQLGGFDLENLVNLGNGRYSAGNFGTFANGGNGVPYSPLELYLAGFIPPSEVPHLWVARDGEWTDERDASGNFLYIFTASEIETWSVRRIVREHGSRVPNWLNSQKSFRAAVVLLADEQFPATPEILRELADAARTFSHPGPDGSRLFNFWEATGGRATLKMDDLGSTTVANRAPVPVGALAPVTLAVDGAPVVVDVAAAFRDPDGDALTYRATSSAPPVAEVTAVGTGVRVTPVAEGTATATVTATDTGGLSATRTFMVTVTSTSNRPPAPVGTLASLTIGVDGAAVTVDVSGAFRDPDGDRLTYGASSSAPGVASVSVSGSRVAVAPAAEGAATVTVTATDVGGSNATATQTFRVTVGPFTDHPIVPGMTPVKAVHFTELRTRIDAVRTAVGLGRYRWTDPVLSAGTRVRLVHLLELRRALDAAYAAAGRPARSWTDAAPAAGTTPIRAAHLMELRAAVVALK